MRDDGVYLIFSYACSFRGSQGSRLQPEREQDDVETGVEKLVSKGKKKRLRRAYYVLILYKLPYCLRTYGEGKK